MRTPGGRCGRTLAELRCAGLGAVGGRGCYRNNDDFCSYDGKIWWGWLLLLLLLLFFQNITWGILLHMNEMDTLRILEKQGKNVLKGGDGQKKKKLISIYEFIQSSSPPKLHITVVYVVGLFLRMFFFSFFFFFQYFNSSVIPPPPFIISIQQLDIINNNPFIYIHPIHSFIYTLNPQTIYVTQKKKRKTYAEINHLH